MNLDEIFKKLFESEILTEDSKVELKEAFQSAVNEAVAAATAEAEVKVRAELTEQMIAEKDLIVEAVDSKTEAFLREHMAEVVEDIAAFRDLEVEKAEQLAEAKAEMAEALKEDMKALVDHVSDFLTESLQENFDEMKEDLKEARKLQFGKAIYEAVAQEFSTRFANTDDTLNALKDTQAQLEEAQKALTETKSNLDGVNRSKKLMEVLSDLNGRPREVMEAILKNFPTEKLEEGYNKFIGRVLHEGSQAEKENGVQPSVLAEGKDNATPTTVTVTGDTPSEVITENEKTVSPEILQMKEYLRKQAGINQ